jgi:hypothetical protein
MATVATRGRKTFVSERERRMHLTPNGLLMEGDNAQDPQEGLLGPGSGEGGFYFSPVDLVLQLHKQLNPQLETSLSRGRSQEALCCQLSPQFSGAGVPEIVSKNFCWWLSEMIRGLASGYFSPVPESSRCPPPSSTPANPNARDTDCIHPAHCTSSRTCPTG